jgi:hypothetical protein
MTWSPMGIATKCRSRTGVRDLISGTLILDEICDAGSIAAMVIARTQKGIHTMINTASNPSYDSSTSENNLNTTESTNAADSKGASSAAAIKEDVDMSADIKIGAVDDADEYSIDQSHVDGGADDDLQKVFAGRPPEDYYWRTHPDKDNEWKLAWTITFEDGTYLVHPKVAEVKRMSERKIRPLLLVRCVNVKGREQVWPLKLDRPGKKRNECNASARMVAELPREEWLMLVYDDETRPTLVTAPSRPSRTSQNGRGAHSGSCASWRFPKTAASTHLSMKCGASWRAGGDPRQGVRLRG